jgi:hypothetical protein
MIGKRIGRTIGGRLCATGALAALVACGQARAADTEAADLFMQSVVRRDGTLGWQQLCAPAQARLPLRVVQDQAAAQRLAEAGAGITFSVDYLASRPNPGGGEIRVYLVTARFPDARTERRTYTLLTESSGCVESIE